MILRLRLKGRWEQARLSTADRRGQLEAESVQPHFHSKYLKVGKRHSVSRSTTRPLSRSLTHQAKLTDTMANVTQFHVANGTASLTNPNKRFIEPACSQNQTRAPGSRRISQRRIIRWSFGKLQRDIFNLGIFDFNRSAGQDVPKRRGRSTPARYFHLHWGFNCCSDRSRQLHRGDFYMNSRRSLDSDSFTKIVFSRTQENTNGMNLFHPLSPHRRKSCVDRREVDRDARTESVKVSPRFGNSITLLPLKKKIKEQIKSQQCTRE